MRWPFTRSAPPVEAKSLGDPSADLLALFGAIPSASGITVSTSEALAVPAVSSCIRVISEAAASLDLSLKRIAGGGEVDEWDHPVAALLRHDPNPWTTWPEMVAHLVANGLCADMGGLAIVTRSGERILEVVQANPGTIAVIVDHATDEPTYTTAGRTLDPDSVIRVRSAIGKAPLGLAKAAIATTVVMARHAEALFARGARPSGALSFPSNLGEEATRKALAGWRAAHEQGDGGGRTAVLFGGAEFRPYALSSVDSEFLGLRKFQLLEICRAFRVPPSLVFDLDRATWGNAEEQGKAFLTYCLEPWLLAVEGALRRALLTPDERPLYRVAIDRDDLTRADLSARATAINSLISSRVLSPNEGRAWLGMAPRDGGDEFANPNINPEASPAKEPAKAPDPASEPEEVAQ